MRCANAIYLLITVFMTLLALVLQHWGAPSFHIYSFDVGCTDVPHMDVDACKGDGAVYRVSMGLFLWFVFLALGTIFGKRSFHTGWWGLKSVLFCILIVGAFFTPNSVFGAGGENSGSYGYAMFARIVSALFLICQIIAFIDFAYHWNTSWVGRAYGRGADYGEDEDDDFEGDVQDRRWLAGILACCAAMMIVVIVGIILMYIFYGGCSLAAFFITLTAISCIGFTVLQLSSSDSDGSLLTSSVVALYSTYLCWSAVNSNPDATCNPSASGSSDPQMIALSFLVAAFSLGWTCYSATVSATSVSKGPKAAEEEVAEAAAQGQQGLHQPLARGNNMIAREGGDVEAGAGKEYDQDDSDETALVHGAPEDAANEGAASENVPDGRIWFFHVVMCCGSLYMAMLLTDWGTGSINSPHDGTQVVHSSSTGSTQMWVKVVSQWIAIVLYTWTLVAPRVCPDREFN